MLLIILSVIMAAGAVVIVTRSGEKEGICKYDYMEDGEK